MENVKYIPGDLVMLKIYGIGVIQVCALDGNHVIIHYLNDNITVGCNIDSVKPIPLIKEVLEKNGWSKNEYEVYFKFFNSKMVVSLIERSDELGCCCWWHNANLLQIHPSTSTPLVWIGVTV